MSDYRHTQWEILEAMRQYGGSFITQLVVLFEHADVQNRKILEESFRHYFHKYDDMITHIEMSQPKKG